ncbi:hypothetical protein [Solilutibacter pythonis]|nr:hypothetical protein [Lysobacter pythonis]
MKKRFVYLPDLSEEERAKLTPMPTPWPLRFETLNFGVYCYNTLRCSVILSHSQFMPDSKLLGPSGPPEPDDKEYWSAGFSLDPSMMRDGYPPGPMWLDWTSLDGVEHEAELDFKEIFPDRLVLHNVPREEIKVGWGFRVWADALVEINDRTVNVYMKALVVTQHPQNPDDPHSNGRRDLILAWTKTY